MLDLKKGCCRGRVSFVIGGSSPCWVPLGGGFTLSHPVSLLCGLKNTRLATEESASHGFQSGERNQSLEFNPTSHSHPALLSTSREEDPMWRRFRDLMAAEHVLEGGWLPEGWSEVQSPHCSHSEMTPASDRHRPQP